MSHLKLPKRLQNSTAYRRSPKQEKELAGRVGGRATIASGALDTKGDVRIKKLARIEAKTTQKKSFSITREMIQKIENASLSTGEVPAIVVEFLDEEGKPIHEVCVLPSYAMDLLMDWK